MKSIWILAIALVIALPGRALAGPEVAVTGDDRAGVKRAVEKALDKKAEIVGEDEAAAVVRVVVKKGKKKWTAIVTAVQAADGKKLASYEVKAKKGKLAKATAAKAWAKLGKALRKAKKRLDEDTPVTEAEPEPVAETVAAAETETAAEPAAETAPSARSERGGAGAESKGDLTARIDRPRKTKAPWLEVAAEGRPFLRQLRYNDDLEGQLRPYDLAAPAVGVAMTLRPMPGGAGRFLALRGELELAVGVNGSETSDGTVYGTSSSEWNAGLRGDFPVAGLRVSIDAAYGEHRFAVDDDEMSAPLVPDVTYRFARGGLGVGIPLGKKLTIDAAAGWRQLLATGDLGSDAWFPRVTGAGLDAELGAAWKVAGPVTMHARADLRRYFFAMNPEVGDALIVGGAVDQYLAFVAGLAVALR